MTGDEEIPILDLTGEVELLWDELNAALQDVLRSGQFILGEAVQSLEAEVADYLGVPHAIGLNSGTDALLIGLRALGVGPGDEVITTAFSFFATAEVVSMLGATPVFVDIEPDTFNLDVRRVEQAITPRTRAVIPVHLYGRPADMPALMELAAQHDLSVVEDAAQAFGAAHGERKVGTFGQAGAFSFFPTKNLGAYGDGGLMVTSDDGLAQTARKLRTHGATRKYHNDQIGYNSRLDALQAAILRVKLRYVDEWNAARREVARRYSDWLADVRGLVLPGEGPDACHVYHQYTIRVLDGKRDAVRAALADANVGTMIYYPVPLHQLPVYASRDAHLPHAEQAAREVLSLPMWPQITPAQQQRVVEVLRAALAG